MLKPRCCMSWRMRMEQYIQMIDYSLWEVIENGNAPPITKVVEGVETIIAPITTKEKAQRSLECQVIALHGCEKKVLEGMLVIKKNQSDSSKVQTSMKILMLIAQRIDRFKVADGYAKNEGKEILEEDWKDQAKEGPTNFALMAYSYTSSNTEPLQKRYEKLELAQKQKDEIQLTVENFKNSSKSLSKLIDCQIVDKLKTGLGYNVVSPPYTGNFMPPKLDLSFSGLEEFVNKPIVSEPIVKKLVVETSEAKASADKPKVVRKNFGPPLIEDWISDSEDEAESKPKIKNKTVKLSFAKIEFVKSKEQVKSPRKTTVKQGDQNRLNTHSPRGYQRNWNYMMSQRLGSNFEMINKACYVCGSFDHLPYNYDNHQRQFNNKKMEKGVIKSGCSRHMTGNMSYLTNFEEIDGGYVAFGGNPKGGKITGRATNQKFNFSKYIFESMVKSLENVYGKFLMYPRFVQVFLEKQLDDMSTHTRIHIAPSHTKKIFGNIKRVGKGFSGRVTPLFPTMVVQNQEDMGEDKAVNEEMDGSLVRAATTTSSLKAEPNSGNLNKTQSKATPNESSSLGTSSGGGPRRQETMGDIISQTRSENVSKLSNDPLLARGNTLRSGEDSLKFKELMDFCTKLQQRVLDLEKTKTAQAQEITSLILRFKKLEKKGGSRTHKLKRLYKVGRSAQMVSFDEASLGDHEEASKQGRKIDDINKDVEITLVDETQGRYGDDLMFDTCVLNDEEVFAGQDIV
ncbi:hypothetical protein Tco_0469102 [Tanacetum coccineum]